MNEKNVEWIPKDLDPGNYGKGLGNVKRRWWSYLEYARPPFDMQKEVISTLERLGRLMGNERILDIGAGDFSFLTDMKNLYDHTGSLTGLEPHLEQMDGEQLEAASDGTPLANPLEYLFDIRDIQVVKGIAQDMPFPDNSFDLEFAHRMMYEIPEDNQDRVMQEILRTMSSNGTFVLTTSGESNKL
ncbi:MAG: class I SAM-dependent methyltransferase, partial [Candidatus Saccharimonadales bacterium]